MFKKNLKRKVFSLIIIAMVFSSSVSFGSSFGNGYSGFGTYRIIIPILNNFQWRQIPISRYYEPNKPVEEKPEQPVEEIEKPEVPIEEPIKPDQPIEVEKPEVPVEPERPETPEVPQEPETPEVPERPERPVRPEPPVESNIPGVSQEEQEVLRLVNIERQKAGLQAFRLSSELSNVARDKSKDMAHNNYFSHTSPTHGSPFDMMRAYGINYRSAGENIAKGYNSAQSVVNGWMNSPGHRANILNSSFNTLGVGHYKLGNTDYWTQMFTN